MKKEVKLNGARVLLICSTDNMIWQVLIPHIKDLQKYGATIDCVCSKTGFWFDELKTKYEFNMINVPMTRLPTTFKNYGAFRKLVALQKENNYDLIYCQQPVGGMLGRLLGRKFKIPVIYTAHGYFFFKGNNKIKNCIFKSAERMMARWTDILITMNDEDFAASKKFKCKNCYNISGIGLDVEKYNNEEFDKSQFKKSLGLKENDKVILSVSEFIKRKNHETMIKAFAKLCAERDDVKYVLCGSGKLMAKMQELVDELKLKDKVVFLGYRRDVNKVMQISDIFYHQSLHEGLTMSIMEAMYFKLPIIASSVRGNKNLVTDAGGFLTKAKDVNSQVEALRKLLDDENLRKSMGEFNRKQVNKYLLKNVRQELKEIYKKNQLI